MSFSYIPETLGLSGLFFGFCLGLFVRYAIRFDEKHRHEFQEYDDRNEPSEEREKRLLEVIRGKCGNLD